MSDEHKHWYKMDPTPPLALFGPLEFGLQDKRIRKRNQHTHKANDFIKQTNRPSRTPIVACLRDATIATSRIENETRALYLSNC